MTTTSKLPANGQLDDLILLSPEEVAQLLGISRQTLAQWRCSGRGPAFKRIGGRIRYSAVAVRQFVGGDINNTHQGEQ